MQNISAPSVTVKVFTIMTRTGSILVWQSEIAEKPRYDKKLTSFLRGWRDQYPGIPVTHVLHKRVSLTKQENLWLMHWKTLAFLCVCEIDRVCRNRYIFINQCRELNENYCGHSSCSCCTILIIVFCSLGKWDKKSSEDGKLRVTDFCVILLTFCIF